MSIVLPNLNHSFVSVPVPFPDSGFPGFPYAGKYTVFNVKRLKFIVTTAKRHVYVSCFCYLLNKTQLLMHSNLF